MNTEKPNYIDWAEKTLEESETRFHLDECTETYLETISSLEGALCTGE